MVRVTPASSCRNSWVLRLMRAEKSVRQGDGLVERVGVQALGLAADRRHGLDGGAGDVVEHVLRRQAPAAGLGVGAQGQRAAIPGANSSRISRAHSSRAARCLATSMK